MGIRLAEPLIDYHNSTQELGPLDISGTVRAWRTPDWYTDTRTIPNNTPPPTGCLRPPQLYVQPEVRVELLDSVTENVLATTYSDLAGNYVLTAPAAGTYKVEARLRGQNLEIVDQVSSSTITVCGKPVDVFAIRLNSVSTNTTDNDITYNTALSRFDTAAADTHEAMRTAWQYWRSQLQGTEPFLQRFVYTRVDFPSGAAFGPPNQVTTSTCPTIHIGSVDPAYLPFSSDSVVAHEFGHFVAFGLPGSLEWSGQTPFAEGYADAHAMIVVEDDAVGNAPTVLGPDMTGPPTPGVPMCGTALRSPLNSNPSYPFCVPAAENYGAYRSGELVGALWIDYRLAGGSITRVRSTFATWTLLAETPNPAACQADSYPESAGPCTFMEVVIANDDDGSLANGTPDLALLCSIYAARSIEPLDDICP